MKIRLLKWGCLVLLALLLAPIAGLAGVWGYHRYVITRGPGELETSLAAAGLRAKADPFIGTGGVPYLSPYNSPAAQCPWGMVRLGPDTASILTSTPGLNASGYYYGDNKIIGFSHARLLGADAHEGGDVRVFPTVEGRVERARKAGRRAYFSHRGERAFPGYYAVRLKGSGVLAELTATPRVGVHRYTFGAGQAPRILVDASSGLGGKRAPWARLAALPGKQGFEGALIREGDFSRRYGGLKVYFAGVFSQAYAACGMVRRGGFIEGEARAEGADVVGEFQFPPGEKPVVVELRVALSFVSEEGAWANLEAEAGDAEFDVLAQRAGAAWEEVLGRIQVSGGTERQQRIFYTALYRACSMPSRFADVTGAYLGFDGEIHQARDFEYYTDFSLWDTFRTVHPLYNLIAAEEQRDMMVSLVEMAKAGGGLPRWAAGGGYTRAMFGTPADVAAAEAYLKGLRGFDIETAYASMRETALGPVPEGGRRPTRRALEAYREHGYVPGDLSSHSVAYTLEYAWADHALSLLARELGRREDAAVFAQQAASYRQLFNPETQYFQPRDSRGAFSFPFDPERLTYTDPKGHYTHAYVEGSANQWRWSVPFDPEGLAALFEESGGGLVPELEAFFEGSRARMGAWHPGGHYWHGNEHDLFAAYLFAVAGRPDLTQAWVRWALETRYDDNHVGLDGNDDGGTLSAWYVFSALGIYPMAGSTRYVLGAPLFDEAQVKAPHGTLHIIAENQAPDHPYVEQVTWNGEPVASWWIDHAQLSRGGQLRFKMSGKPVGH